MKENAEKKILLAEIERLAKKVWELKGRNPDAIFYGLPLWVQAIDPSAVGTFAKGNPLFNEFRQAVLDAFDLNEEVDSLTDREDGAHE